MHTFSSALLQYVSVLASLFWNTLLYPFPDCIRPIDPCSRVPDSKKWVFKNLPLFFFCQENTISALAFWLRSGNVSAILNQSESIQISNVRPRLATLPSSAGTFIPDYEKRNQLKYSFIHSDSCYCRSGTYLRNIGHKVGIYPTLYLITGHHIHSHTHLGGI